MRSFLFGLAATSAFTVVSARSLPVTEHTSLVKRQPNGWNYYGCWTDEGDRQLGGASYHTDTMTPAVCISFCQSKGYSFAGVKYSRECFCGYNLKSKSVIKDDGECGMSCAGDADSNCGGPNRLNVYTSKARTQIVTNPGPVGSGWTYKSCYEDSVYGRTLAHQVQVSGGNSVSGCTSACKAAGYKIAGVQWSSECFCDNTINFDRPNGLEGCDMVCDGNTLEYCGGSQKLNVYMFEPLPSSTTATQVVTSTTTSLSTSTTTTTTSSTITSAASSTTSSTTTTSEAVTTSWSTLQSQASTTTADVITTSSTSTKTQQSTTTTTTSATCIPTPKVSPEQAAKDKAALEFLEEHNTLVKMMWVLPWNEYGSDTVGGDDTVLGPIHKAVNNWVNCTDQIELNAKQLDCGKVTSLRPFLSCIIFRTSPAVKARYGARADLSPSPDSSVQKLYINHRYDHVPGTGEIVSESNITIGAFFELKTPTLYDTYGNVTRRGGIVAHGPNMLFYFGENNYLGSGA